MVGYNLAKVERLNARQTRVQNARREVSLLTVLLDEAKLLQDPEELTFFKDILPLLRE